ncbi:MAG: molybdopterin-binding protein [Rhodobacteraceae bacterium]|nr:molybdopterin-binding protein [Paracoccaceae bacterium]
MNDRQVTSEIPQRPDPSPKARLAPDCFSLPPGVDWLPVEDALDRLRRGLSTIADIKTVPVSDAAGYVLANSPVARRASPPRNNSAVDGYGFAYSSVVGDEARLRLAPGRAAPGHPWPGPLEAGHAVKILTGAFLPEGVDTVVLDEYSSVHNGFVSFAAPRRQGGNARMAGEDIRKGDRLFKHGQRIRANCIATLVAAGIEQVEVFERLKVAVLSTGDELCNPTDIPGSHQIYDANRPMLLSLVARWGFSPVDLGCADDRMGDIRKRLDAGARQADMILTSGGASAGDEDHVSRLLSTEGDLEFWRIALKPGRPLAAAKWRGTPVLGLPGNPIAAFVCSLIFARPVLCRLSGEPWTSPVGFKVPAAFEKSKKEGRREFLRARLKADGSVDVFRSEGSGLTTGLAWSDGLVELDEPAMKIRRGDLVRYIPYGSFGL